MRLNVAATVLALSLRVGLGLRVDRHDPGGLFGKLSNFVPIDSLSPLGQVVFERYVGSLPRAEQQHSTWSRLLAQMTGLLETQPKTEEFDEEMSKQKLAQDYAAKAAREGTQTVVHERDVHTELYSESTPTENLLPLPLPAGFTDWRDIPRAVLSAEQQKYIKLDPLQCPKTCDPSFCSNQPEGETQCYKVLDPTGKNEKICEKFSDEKTYECPVGYTSCSTPLFGPNVHFADVKIAYGTIKNNTMVMRGHNLNGCYRVFAVREDQTCEEQNAEALFEDGNDVMTTPFNIPNVQELEGNEQKAFIFLLRFLEVGKFKVCGFLYDMVSRYPDSPVVRHISQKQIGSVVFGGTPPKPHYN